VTERRGPLWTVALLLVAAAAALWGSGRLDWGTATTPRYGAGLAFVAIAGLAGTVAAGGWVKRLVGVVVALAGLLAGGVTVTAGGTGIGRWIALLGALLLVAAGILVIRHAARLPTLGTRYQSANARPRSGDGDRDMWDGLSQGEDPTVRNVEDER
jgi:hypothetical protein